MYTYRICLDAYTGDYLTRGARVVVFVQGYDRADALRKIRAIGIDTAGRVFTGHSRADGWIGTNNMPPGPVKARSLMFWDLVTIRSVRAAGENHVLNEYQSQKESDHAMRYADLPAAGN